MRKNCWTSTRAAGLGNSPILADEELELLLEAVRAAARGGGAARAAPGFSFKMNRWTFRRPRQAPWRRPHRL